MSARKISLIAAAALLAATGVASADPTSQGNRHRCWDNLAQQVREQSTRASQNAATGSEAGNVQGSTGSSTNPKDAASQPTASSQGSHTGLPSAMNRPGTSPTSNASPPTRPREAQGLPDCNT